MVKNQKKLLIEARIKRLKEIKLKLNGLHTIESQLEFIDNLEEIKGFFSQNKALQHHFDNQDLNHNRLLKTIIIIGQGKLLAALFHDHFSASSKFLRVLQEIDQFYEKEFGLVIYQLNVLTLILEDLSQDSWHKSNEINYIKPPKIDFSKKTPLLNESIRQGIENWQVMAEIYPVGGAGERLKLIDEMTKMPLPVATLPFLGRNLLTGLIRDLEAKEFLAFKLTGKQQLTPVAMMTSHEKQNHEHILRLCESSNWFNRGKDQFFLFSQPMVPVVTEYGDWILSSSNDLLLKPGGHGVIWKLAQEKGVFDWLKTKGIKKMLTRQINNPAAGTDGGLISFAGFGIKENKAFGFSSCDRVVNTSEGMDILIEKKETLGFSYKITNIEYTEFLKKGIEDKAEDANRESSKFPANTNILFLDIEETEKAIEKIAVPGMLMNMKSTIPSIDASGNLRQIKVGRLESTMQNIADEIIDLFPQKLKETEYGNLKSYLTYNERNKTIAVTKKSFSKDSFLETPESCFYIIQSNYHDLFEVDCGFNMPAFRTFESYLEKGPLVLIDLHPALGPLYSIISQKIKGGKIFENSELQLEIAELEMENLELEGSLIIKADHVTGGADKNGILQYGKNLGKCSLKNVKVKNLGFERNNEKVYWKKDYERLESLSITLHGNAEFIAENVTFKGNYNLEVNDGERLTVSMVQDKLHVQREKIPKDHFYWIYEFNKENEIVLRKNTQD